jgi:hypothetical protein
MMIAAVNCRACGRTDRGIFKLLFRDLLGNTGLEHDFFK